MTPSEQKQWYDEHKRLMAEFLANGGEIQQVPAGWEPKPADDPADWISTKEACALIGVTPQKLSTWRATHASLPRNRKEGKAVVWFLPSVQAFARIYQGKQQGRKAA